MSIESYLSFLVEQYKKGELSVDKIRMLLDFYVQNGTLSKESLEDWLDRITKKEYTIDEKRDFLAAIRTVDGKEFKYGDLVYNVPDDMIEMCYKEEEKNLSAADFEKYHSMAEYKRNGLHNENEEAANWYKPLEQDDIEEISDSQEITDSKKNIDFSQNIREKEMREHEELSVEQLQKVEGGIAPDIAYERARDNKELFRDEKFEEDTDEPETEEEYQNVAHDMNKTEKDSTVRQVEASPERINKLKKKKGKVKNYFIKTAIVVGALALMHPIESIPLIGGYLYFASEIKNGKFMPKNKFQELIKKTVEKVMYIGMNKEEVEVEKGKSR